MNRFKLGENGPEVSRIAYGAWRLAEDSEGTSVARIREKIDTCLDSGITTFDHADIYGMYTCEGLFGKALAEAPGLRDRMEIVTKCGIQHACAARPGVYIKHYNLTAEHIAQSVDCSLSELRTDRIDVLLVHRPDWLTDAYDTAAGLHKVMETGKVRSVGVSNYSVHQYELIAHCLGAAPVTNQIELSLLRMDPIFDGTLDQCQRYGARPMAWSPLGGGRLMTADGDDASRAREALMKLGAEYDATADQMALAWVAALPCAPQIVIGTNQPERIRSAAASDAIRLERQHWYALWEAAQGREVP